MKIINSASPVEKCIINLPDPVEMSLPGPIALYFCFNLVFDYKICKKSAHWASHGSTFGLVEKSLLALKVRLGY